MTGIGPKSRDGRLNGVSIHNSSFDPINCPYVPDWQLIYSKHVKGTPTMIKGEI